MSLRQRLSRILAVTFLALATTAYAIEINPALEQLEKSLEARVKGNLQTFFGNDAKVMVSVHATPDLTEAKPVDPAKSGESDVGYIPLPFALNTLSGDQNDQAAAKNIKIKELAVDIQVPKETPQAVLDSVRGVVAQSLKGLNPKVTVGRLTIASQELQRGLAGKAEEPKAEDQAKEKTPFDFRPLLALLGVLGAASILALGIYFVARALSTAGASIAEGFKGMRASTQNTEDKPLFINQKVTGDSGPEKTGQPPTLPTALKDYRRNVGLVRQILNDQPMIFVQTLGDGDADFLGLKWLLPCLESREQERLQQFLGPERVSKLAEVGKDGAFFDGPSWLQSFTERVMIKKIEGGSFVERELGADRALKLYEMKPALILEAAQNLSTTPHEKSAWRIAAEFLPKEQFERSLSTGSTGDLARWQTLVDAAEVTPDELRSAADQFIELAQKSPQAGAVGSDKSKYYSDTLLGPVVASLLARPLGEDDQFLDQMQSMSADFAAIVREKFWTPSRLATVPQDYLEKIVKGLSPQQKAALLLAFPEPHAARLAACLPEGTGKTIALDQVKKAKARNQPEELKAATTICREFLDFLRRQAQASQFTPVEGAATAGIAEAATPETPPPVLENAA